METEHEAEQPRSTLLRRLQPLLAGSIVGGLMAVILAGLLSLLRPELVFAGFPMGAALGGGVAGYLGRRLPIAQGAAVGLVVGLVEIGFLAASTVGTLMAVGIAGLVAINGITGTLGAHLARSLPHPMQPPSYSALEPSLAEKAGGLPDEPQPAPASRE